MTANLNLRGILLMLMSGASFMINDSFLKLNMASLPPYQVLVLRGFCAMGIGLALIIALGEFGQWRKCFNRFVFARAGLEATAILTYILALAHAPIGDVTAIFQITPLLVILGMIFIHGERADPWRLSLVALGFCGAMLVAQPGAGVKSPFLMLAFVTAVFAAVRDLAGRRIPADVPMSWATVVTIIIVAVAAMVCNLLFETWRAPALGEIGFSVAAGVGVMLGHLLTLLAYRHASAQAIAPFYYSFMVFAVIAGYFIFGDVPNSWSILGMIVIMISGLGVIALERRNVKDAYQYSDL